MRRVLIAVCGVALILSVAKAGTGRRELIVTLKPGESIRQINEENGTTTIDHVARTSIYLIEVDDDDQALKVVQNVRRNVAVESVEDNDTIELSATDGPVSAGADLGHAMSDLLDGNSQTIFYGTQVLKAYAMQPALDLIRVNQVRNQSTGAGTRVAYIDTGIDPDHPALKPWVEPGVDLVNGSSASEWDGLSHAMADLLDHAMSDLLDPYFFFVLNRSLGNLLAGSDNIPSAFGHGTLVAGLIHVTAPQAKLYPIKAFDPDGSTTMFRLVEGVYAAIDAGADVLNMSFSTATDSATLHKALDTAQAAGITLVAAMGNDGQDVRDRYPAAYPLVYGIAATDLDDKLAGFSNYGKSVSLTAPGAMVITTAPAGHYAVAWGTSFSSPIVAGALAVLATTTGPGHSEGSVLVNTADSIDAKNPGFEKKLGKGRINLESAFKVKN